MASKSSKARAAFERANREAARIIATDPVKYPRDSLLGEWASLVLHRERCTPPVEPPRRPAA
jgi:hypothetical protein